MKYVGADLHKRTVSLCVVEGSGSERRVVSRRRLPCDEEKLRAYFLSQGEFQVAVEATAAFDWFVRLAEPLAQRVVLAHPRKLRVIAESTRKTDRVDAQVLAEFLATSMLPEAHCPTPRQREHQVLVRRRQKVVSRITSTKNQLRGLLARYNADTPRLFTEEGQAYLATLSLAAADRFVVTRLREDLAYQTGQLASIESELRRFANQAPPGEQRARELLQTMPYLGPTAIDMLLSELGDLRRFRSQKQVAAYAGLAPGVRASAGKSHAVGITHAGSRRLRWALIEAAWRMVARVRRWGLAYERLRTRTGAKKAIVAVARRILCTVVSMLKTDKRYNSALEVLA